MHAVQKNQMGWAQPLNVYKKTSMILFSAKNPSKTAFLYPKNAEFRMMSLIKSCIKPVSMPINEAQGGDNQVHKE